MKNENDNNKTNATDTLKNMGTDAKEAVKKDYEQTKADMENMKDKVMGDDDMKGDKDVMMDEGA